MTTQSDRPVTLLPALDRSTPDAGAPGDPSERSVQSATNVRPSKRILPDLDKCPHVDLYGSMVMEGGPYSAHPGQLMCIGCDRRYPFLEAIA